MRITEQALRRALRRWGRRRERSIEETIAEARRAADAMNRPVRHNPDSPDADLRYAPFGPLTP